jgi:hypothetical protein
VTTTVAVVAVRLLVTVTPCRVPSPPAATTNAVAALWPAVAVPFWAAAARAPSWAAAIATVRPW